MVAELYDKKVQVLLSESREVRLSALASVRESIANGILQRNTPITNEVNNHIHTWYSFSPYSPAMAAYKAWDAGLQVCGLVDHESIAGGEEIRDACKSFGLGSTVGFELRVNFYGTSIENKKINNPESRGIAYTVIHGVSDLYFLQVNDFLKPIRKARMERNEKMVGCLSSLLGRKNLPSVSFEKDVLPLSLYTEGGSITERHILYACVKMLIAQMGKGQVLVDSLEKVFQITLNEKMRGFLLDVGNIHYEYDVLGLLKMTLLPQVYIDPDECECIPAKKAVDFAKQIHAIPAYAYLGDVGDSVTGDKKIEKFEDAYIEELFCIISDTGYLACTYMPPRNSIEQLRYVSQLCRKYNLMEISGVDINSSRQNFLYRNPDEFNFLNNSAWALAGHEYIQKEQKTKGMFDENGEYSQLPLHDKLLKYADIGKNVERYIKEV